MHFSRSKLKVRVEGSPAVAIETELHVVHVFLYNHYINFRVSTPGDARPAEASRCSCVLDWNVFSLFSRRPPHSLVFPAPMQSEAMLNPSCAHAVCVCSRDSPGQTDKVAELFLERTVCAESDTVRADSQAAGVMTGGDPH